MGGLFAGLPAFISPVIAGAAAVKLGMDGIKQAASVLTPEIDQLKSVMSTTFAQDLGPAMVDLKSVFPVLQQAMPGVAAGMSDMAGALAGAVASGPGLSDIRTTLTSVGSFFTAISPAVNGFVSNFLHMAAVGSQALGPLATALNTITQGFTDMLNQSMGSGDFLQAILGAVGIIQALGTVLNQVIGMAIHFGAVFNSSVATTVTTVGNILAALEPALQGLGQGFMDILNPLLGALLPVVQALSPAFGQLAAVLGGALGSAITQLSPMLTQIAQLIGGALSALTPIIGPIVDVVSSLAQAFGSILLQALQALAPLWPIITQALQMVATAVGQLAPLWIGFSSNVSTWWVRSPPSSRRLSRLRLRCCRR